MFPMDRQPIKVVIEYDAKGERVTREFKDACASRRFYVAKDREGKHPKIVSAVQMNA